MNKINFSNRLLDWYQHNGRKDLPWKKPATPYRTWLSEIMLQQTQVTTVIPYFEKFTARFPDVMSLANAELDDVLTLWAGLGYYARGRNLHKAAKVMAEKHNGDVPPDFDALLNLPGIGRSTAGAIMAQAFDEPHAILDGNVKRVLARYHGVSGWPGDAVTSRKLWAYAEQHTPDQHVADYTQAIMDLGAVLCTRKNPGCEVCPVRGDCRALAEDAVDCYPTPKPGRLRPLRETTMLVLQRADGHVLLQRRPSAGIWGGLWCFPEADNVPLQHCLTEFGVQPGEVIELGVIRHGFTHFQLDIQPLLIRVKDSGTCIGENRQVRWVLPGRQDLALPKPVASIIENQLCG